MPVFTGPLFTFSKRFFSVSSALSRRSLTRYFPDFSRVLPDFPRPFPEFSSLSFTQSLTLRRRRIATALQTGTHLKGISKAPAIRLSPTFIALTSDFSHLSPDFPQPLPGFSHIFPHFSHLRPDAHHTFPNSSHTFPRLTSDSFTLFPDAHHTFPDFTAKRWLASMMTTAIFWNPYKGMTDFLMMFFLQCSTLLPMNRQ